MDNKTVIECLVACAETKYKDSKKFNSKFTKKEHFDFGIIDGFIAQKGKNIRVIVFRGSDEMQDWFANFFIAKKKIPYEGTNPKIRVQSGWVNEYKEIREFIHEKVKDFKEVIVTGQSLGGAIATLCAVDIQYNFGIKIECLPFGSPRVGNKCFAESFIKRVPNTQRFVHGRDLVTMFPPRLFGYRHVCDMISFGPKRNLIFIPSIKHHLVGEDQIQHLKEFFNET